MKILFSFYPLYPVPLDFSKDVNLDISHSDLLSIPQKSIPDIIVLPSRLQHFTKARCICCAGPVALSLITLPPGGRRDRVRKSLISDHVQRDRDVREDCRECNDRWSAADWRGFSEVRSEELGQEGIHHVDSFVTSRLYATVMSFPNTNCLYDQTSRASQNVSFGFNNC